MTIPLLLDEFFGFTGYTIKRKGTGRRDGLGRGRSFVKRGIEEIGERDRLEASVYGNKKGDF